MARFWTSSCFLLFGINSDCNCVFDYGFLNAACHGVIGRCLALRLFVSTAVNIFIAEQRLSRLYSVFIFVLYFLPAIPSRLLLLLLLTITRFSHSTSVGFVERVTTDLAAVALLLVLSWASRSQRVGVRRWRA